MVEQVEKPIDVEKIRKMLNQKKRMKYFLKICASCGFCADSCFLYQNHKDPKYMPSYKAINTLGRLFKKRGKVGRKDMIEMKELMYDNCVLCGRCYCPFGIDISRMISWARTICRTQGVYERYDLGCTGAKDESKAS